MPFWEEQPTFVPGKWDQSLLHISSGLNQSQIVFFFFFNMNPQQVAFPQCCCCLLRKGTLSGQSQPHLTSDGLWVFRNWLMCSSVLLMSTHTLISLTQQHDNILFLSVKNLLSFSLGNWEDQKGKCGIYFHSFANSRKT